MLSSAARRLAPFLCAFALLLAAGPAAAATTFTPDRFDDPILPAKSCTPPAPANGCSLRGAIESAQAGDTVQLGAGTYRLERGSLKLPKAITIVGAGAAATTIRQTALDRVIEIENQAGLTMSGVTITGGHLIGQAGANGLNAGDKGKEGEGVYGAGIDAGGAVTLTDVVVTGNQAYGGDGGNGAAGTSGAGGEGGRGGYATGAGIDGGSSLTLVRVTVSDNIARGGDGGAGGSGGTNGAGGKGGSSGSAGGVGVSLGTSSALTVTDSAITGNQGGSGDGGPGGAGGTTAGAGGAGGQGESSEGGAIFSNGTVKLTNVTITGNSVSGADGGDGGAARSLGTASTGGAGGWSWGGSGGAIALMNGAAGQFASVTIAGNEAGTATPSQGGAGSSGGAAGADGGKSGTSGGNLFVYNASLTIRGTIVAAGRAEAANSDCGLGGGGTLLSAGHNLEDRDQCIAAPKVGDLHDVPAGLGALADNGGPTETMALLGGSAAIGAGEASCVGAAGQPLGTDQRGLPRFSPCDIGAFQVQPPAPPVPAPPDAGGPTPSPPPKAVLKGLALSPAKVRAGKKVTIKFELNLAARVGFALERSRPGVRVGGKCVARSARHAAGQACPRWVKAGGAPATVDGRAGANSVPWTPARLAPDKYRLVATPAGGGSVSGTFSVARPSRAKKPA
ncbi:MAG TPA: choice-of-anchor Q domain-containing protein [Solirubrobacterales bacterium]|nr:choice-of-anchor Q domain-containing protein [Solirubrobacterales bacterium]